jgi:hypothetical protein
VEDEGVVVGAGEDVENEVNGEVNGLGEGVVVNGEANDEVDGMVDEVGIKERMEEGEGIEEGAVEGERMENGEVMREEMGEGEEMRNGEETETGTTVEEENGEALIWVQLVDEPVPAGSRQGEVGGGERECAGLENGESGCDSTAEKENECRAANNNESNGVTGVDESGDSDGPSKWDSDVEETQAWRDKLRSVSLYLPKSLKVKDKRMSLPYFKNMWSRSRKGSLQSTAG